MLNGGRKLSVRAPWMLREMNIVGEVGTIPVIRQYGIATTPPSNKAFLIVKYCTSQYKLFLGPKVKHTMVE